jgi:small GTP-binding protein
VIEDVEGVRVNAILWDTAGQEDFVNVRKLTYDQTDIFLVVYSVVSQNSFANLKSKWLPELRQQVGQRLRWVLVGNKCDMLTDEKTMADMKAAGETPVSEKDAKKFGKENGAELFLTCTGRDVDSVNGVFHEVLKLVVQRDLKQLKKDKKQWEKEIKEEKKLEEKMAKLALKEEKRSSKRTSNTTA